MNQKRIFLMWSRVAVLLLFFVAFILVITVALGHFEASDAMSLFGLFLNVVVGIFTVWGLFWAASQFSEQSVKPRIRLILGEVEESAKGNKCAPVENSPVPLIGHKTNSSGKMTGRLDVALFLENIEPRMAQHLQLVIEGDGSPLADEVLPLQDSFAYQYRANLTNNRMMLQFEDDLIVYKGQGVYVGIIRFWWRQGLLPDVCKVRYTVYKSEGELDSGQHDITIDWS